MRRDDQFSFFTAKKKKQNHRLLKNISLSTASVNSFEGATKMINQKGFWTYLWKMNNAKRMTRKAVKTVRGYEVQREFYLKVAMPVLLSVLPANSLFQMNRTWKIVSIHGHNFLHPNLLLRSKILSRYFFSLEEILQSPPLEQVPHSIKTSLWPHCHFLLHSNSKTYPMHIPFIPISQPVNK